MGAFAASARILAGHSARLLAWTPDIFWNATPEELAASFGGEEDAANAPTRALIAQMMERDGDGRL